MSDARQVIERGRDILIDELQRLDADDSERAAEQATWIRSMLDMHGEVLTALDNAPKRSRHSKARLTLAEVTDIRKRFANGEKGTALAHDYGVSQSTVSRIVNGHLHKIHPASKEK